MAQKLEVLLREHVDNLGRCGDIVRVPPGYARNYLLPRKLAVTATPENKKLMQRRRVRLDAEEAAHNAELDARVASLAGVSVTARERADESGHLFGSVNAARIAELLTAAGHAFEEQDVRLEHPLKQVGAHPVRVHLFGERFAEVQVVVEAEGA